MEYRPSIRRPRRRAISRFSPPIRLLPLGLAALALSLFVLLLRGCAITREETGVPGALPEDISAVIAVYDDENDRVLSMRLEEYLCGVVAAEMPASFEEEALKAQAIVARNYAVRSIRSTNIFDVYDTSRSQVYRGIPSNAPNLPTSSFAVLSPMPGTPGMLSTASPTSAR